MTTRESIAEIIHTARFQLQEGKTPEEHELASRWVQLGILECLAEILDHLKPEPMIEPEPTPVSVEEPSDAPVDLVEEPQGVRVNPDGMGGEFWMPARAYIAPADTPVSEPVLTELAPQAPQWMEKEPTPLPSYLLDLPNETKTPTPPVPPEQLPPFPRMEDQTPPVNDTGSFVTYSHDYLEGFHSGVNGGEPLFDKGHDFTLGWLDGRSQQEISHG
ncbi:MAG: hypothetical protein FWG15_02910 [Propionibacteriaceae bacterium]|nr:hypothetical protein [Propionibacteriaceae bacterium]